MTVLNKAALIEQAARAQWASCWPGLPWPAGDAITVETWSHDTAAALPVIAKALLAPLRELHPSIPRTGRAIGPDDEFTRVIRWMDCLGCGNRYPCPTVRLLDAIEAEASA